MRFLLATLALSIFVLATRIDTALEAGPLDALDAPWAIAAASDGGFWVALQTDTVAGLSYYAPDRSKQRDFMAWVSVPLLAVGDDGNLFVGGDAASIHRGSRIVHFSADGRHQGTWAQHPTYIVDMDMTAKGEIVSLEVDVEAALSSDWPPVADQIVRYSLEGRRLEEQHSAQVLTDVAATVDGGLYVAIRAHDGSAHIARLTGEGAPSASVDLSGQVVGMDFDGAGDLLVAEVMASGKGRAHRFQVDDRGIHPLDSWDACYEPRDLTVTTGGSIIVLARTPMRELATQSAICAYAPDGQPLEESQIPVFTGIPSPTATPEPGRIQWLPMLLGQR